MDQIKAQLDALFNSAGKRYEQLTYINARDPHGERFDDNYAELIVLQELLTALAPLKEKL